MNDYQIYMATRVLLWKLGKTQICAILLTFAVVLFRRKISNKSDATSGGLSCRIREVAAVHTVTKIICVFVICFFLSFESSSFFVVLSCHLLNLCS